MLTLFRRHKKKCKHRKKGRAYRRCQCPIWVDGFLGKEEIRESLNERDWNKASDKIHGWEARGTRQPEPESVVNAPMTIDDGCEKFLRDLHKGRKLKETTLYKYRVLFRRLRSFADERGFRFLCELTLDELTDFRATWPDENLSALKNLERLRAFLGFCQVRKWITENEARNLENPKVTDSPTLPLNRNEVAAIVFACDRYPDRLNAVRLRAFVLVLRYSGLRIRDVVMLTPDRIDREGKLFLYTAKTGTPVSVPLPQVVLDALAKIPLASNAKYYFWTGESNIKSAVGNWQRSLRRLVKLAGVPDAHAHRFRDTFAVELLLAGVPIDRVSILLGHKSVKVTERHYSPWVSARQEQLEADVRRTWDRDLLTVDFTKGTREVHGDELQNQVIESKVF